MSSFSFTLPGPPIPAPTGAGVADATSRTIVTDYPRSVVEARAALGYGTFSHGWLCDELSGDLAPAFGGLTLAAGGTGTVYGDPGPGGLDDRTIGFDSPRTGTFGGAQAFDVTATDDLVVAWVGMWLALPTIFGAIVGKAAAAFANGWAITGTNGTAFTFDMGPSAGFIGTIAGGTSAYHVGSWHVGIAAIERVTGRARIGTRSLPGTTLMSNEVSVGAASFSTVADFAVGASAWVPANDSFRLSALFIGKSVGAATGISANLATALQNFAAYITRVDNYKAKVMRGWLPPPYNRDFGAVVPSILTVIGQSDNLIGGLFGQDDFLPDEG